MIRSLRSWHRRWIFLLAVTLAWLLFFALRTRPQVPWMDALPTAAAPLEDPGSEEPQP